MWRRAACVVLLSLAAGLPGARAQEGGEEAPAFAFRWSLKNSALVARAPEDPVLFPDRDSATGFWRFRVEPDIRLGGGVTLDVAFEQRVRAFSSAASSGAGVLPPEAAAPFRIRQLDWRLASSSNAEWRGEIDRAAVHVHRSAVDVTVGRQAIGWGRGVLFGAIDLFSPFTPLEADREWRRGVDAVRGDVKLGDRSSLDLVGAFGDGVDRSAFGARLRGYAGKADVELVGGRRARDLFGGIASSAAVGGAEVHGELAVFRVPSVPGSTVFAADRAIVKAVAGASWRVPVGNGVLVYAEYHYSGFGADRAAAIVPRLADPAFLERYLRGDTQILERHALAALASYEVSPELALGAEWLQSPVDGSGVVVPSATWTFGDRWSMLASLYLPFGRAPAGGTLGSAFGATPLGLFAQLKVYH